MFYRRKDISNFIKKKKNRQSDTFFNEFLVLIFHCKDCGFVCGKPVDMLWASCFDDGCK
jgi:hypothetical protein